MFACMVFTCITVTPQLHTLGGECQSAAKGDLQCHWEDLWRSGNRLGVSLYVCACAYYILCVYVDLYASLCVHV